jgi:hypothetical protein
MLNSSKCDWFYKEIVSGLVNALASSSLVRKKIPTDQIVSCESVSLVPGTWYPSIDSLASLKRLPENNQTVEAQKSLASHDQ